MFRGENEDINDVLGLLASEMSSPMTDSKAQELRASIVSIVDNRVLKHEATFHGGNIGNQPDLDPDSDSEKRTDLDPKAVADQNSPLKPVDSNFTATERKEQVHTRGTVTLPGIARMRAQFGDVVAKTEKNNKETERLANEQLSLNEQVSELRKGVSKIGKCQAEMLQKVTSLWLGGINTTGRQGNSRTDLIATKKDLEKLETSTEARINQLSAKIDAVEKSVNSLKNTFLKQLEQYLGQMKERMDTLEAKVSECKITPEALLAELSQALVMVNTGTKADNPQ